MIIYTILQYDLEIYYTSMFIKVLSAHKKVISLNLNGRELKYFHFFISTTNWIME